MNPMMRSSSEAIDLRPPLTPEHIRKVVSVVDVIADDHVDGAGFSSASTLNRQIKQLRKNPELNSKRKKFFVLILETIYLIISLKETIRSRYK